MAVRNVAIKAAGGKNIKNGSSSLVRPGSVQVVRKGERGGDTRTGWRPQEEHNPFAQRDVSRNQPVTSDFAERQESRTTGSQLMQRNREQSTKGDTTVPRDLDRDERVRRINARGKTGLLSRARKKNLESRLGKIKSKGKGNLAQKAVTKFAFRGVLYASSYIAPIQLGFFIIYVVAISIYSIPLLDALIGLGFPPIVIEAVKNAVAILTGGSEKVGYAYMAVLLGNPVTGPILAPILGPFAAQALLKESGILEGIFYAGYGATVVIGLGAMLAILIMYKMAPIGIHPLSGSRATVKWLLFITVVLLHVIPFVNFAPWFLIWAWYVSKHPA